LPFQRTRRRFGLVANLKWWLAGCGLAAVLVAIPAHSPALRLGGQSQVVAGWLAAAGSRRSPQLASQRMVSLFSSHACGLAGPRRAPGFARSGPAPWPFFPFLLYFVFFFFSLLPFPFFFSHSEALPGLPACPS